MCGACAQLMSQQAGQRCNCQLCSSDSWDTHMYETRPLPVFVSTMCTSQGQRLLLSPLLLLLLLLPLLPLLLLILPSDAAAG
jgi:hypothetical protein